MSGKALSEDKFPTVKAAHAVLAELIASGFGDLPVQILVVPDSTLQALARHAGATDDAKPTLMLEFDNTFCIITADRLEPSVAKRAGIQ